MGASTTTRAPNQTGVTTSILATNARAVEASMSLTQSRALQTPVSCFFPNHTMPPPPSCCMLLHVAACCCVQMLANASWRRLSLTHTPRRCLNARLLLLRFPRPLFFTFRSPHHCHGDSHAHAVLKSKAKWLRWLCKATRSSPSPNKLQLLLCFSFSFLLL